MYLLTRPAPNLEKSQQAFDALGVKVSVLGLNDIAFMKGADDKLALMLKQHSADILIFTSQFAVKACASALSAAVSVPVLAVGKGTVLQIKANCLQRLALRFVDGEGETCAERKL